MFNLFVNAVRFPEVLLSVLKPIVAILATINTKSKEVHFIANVLKRAGATPWIVDLSMKPHNLPLADITGEQVARLADRSWLALDGSVRQEAAAIMVEGGTKLLLEKYTKGDLAGAIGIGGANGTNLGRDAASLPHSSTL